MNDEKTLVLANVRQRMDMLGLDWAGLAEAIDRVAPGEWDATRQMVENWKNRGVPRAQYAVVATALDWTVEQLLGRASSPADEDWPFERITKQRLARLDPSDQLAVEAAALKKIEEIERLAREKNASGPSRAGNGSGPHASAARSRKAAR